MRVHSQLVGLLMWVPWLPMSIRIAPTGTDDPSLLAACRQLRGERDDDLDRDAGQPHHRGPVPGAGCGDWGPVPR